MTRTTAIVLSAGCLVGASAPLTGCVDNKNQRPTIGDGVPLASFPPEVVEPTIDPDGGVRLPEPPADDEASVRGLGRANFSPVVYSVPIDGTRHELHGYDRLAYPSETARQRGEYPTALTALETGGWPSSRDQAVEILAQPITAGGGVLFHTAGLVYPAWLAAHFISGSESSPRPLFERAPAHRDAQQLGVRHTPIDADGGADGRPADPAEEAPAEEGPSAESAAD